MNSYNVKFLYKGKQGDITFYDQQDMTFAIARAFHASNEFSDVSVNTTEDKELSNWKVKDD